jgi:hypothetical protein
MWCTQTEDLAWGTLHAERVEEIAKGHLIELGRIEGKARDDN